MLSLTSTAGYAVLAVACLGKTPGERKLVADISHCTGAPEPYLRKVLKKLADSGLLSAKRGYRGGYSLARPKDEVSVLDIVDAIEGPEWSSRCLLGYAQCSDERACPAHGFWKHEREAIRENLRTVSPSAAERDLLSICGSAIAARDSNRASTRPVGRSGKD